MGILVFGEHRFAFLLPLAVVTCAAYGGLPGGGQAQGANAEGASTRASAAVEDVRVRGRHGWPAWHWHGRRLRLRVWSWRGACKSVAVGVVARFVVAGHCCSEFQVLMCTIALCSCDVCREALIVWALRPMARPLLPCRHHGTTSFTLSRCIERSCSRSSGCRAC